MKKQILLITANYPYSPGEQFLESEISIWGQYIKENLTIELVILPLNATGLPRAVPTNIKVSLVLADNVRSSWPAKIAYIARAFFSSLLWCEIKMILQKKNRVKALISSLKAVASTHRIAAMLQNEYVRKQKIPFAVYSYWFDTAAYGALLAFKDTSAKVIARAHGFDVYEERRPDNYMPIKRQFTKSIAAVYGISKMGASYLTETYGIRRDKVHVARLGVKRALKTNPGGDSTNTFYVVSISLLVSVKRIDKIILALAEFAKMKEDIIINWTHYGDGPLWRQLIQIARTTFSSAPNVNWYFAGDVNNKVLLNNLDNNPYDVFVNASDSEGVPVSIMEAMARGIPTVAPAVGGIPEQIIDGKNGKLVPALFTPKDLAEALYDINFFRDIKTRNACLNKWEECYSAEENYYNFIQEIIKL